MTKKAASNPLGVGRIGVQLVMGALDLRGLHASRPDADAVEIGATYWSVDEPSSPGTIYVSDGASWTTLEVL